MDTYKLEERKQEKKIIQYVRKQMKKLKIKSKGIFVTLGILLAISYIILFPSCKSVSSVTETTSNEKIEIVYKDSVRYYDSVVVIPVERYVDIVNKYDTLFLETSLAEAYAYVDSLFLRGEIKNKDVNQTETIYKDNIIYRDSIVYKDKIVYEKEEVEVENPINYKLLIFNILISVVDAILLYLYFTKK